MIHHQLRGGAFLLVLLSAIAGACRRADTTHPAARSLLLFTIDTLRADHVGAYGYARARTPAIDALARSGTTFDRAYAAAPICSPLKAWNKL